MYNRKAYELGSVRSVIRELFEYGKKRAAEMGADKVFDFSLGNPSVAPPAKVAEAIKEFVDTMEPVALHGYTSAQGDYGVRKAIADYINERFSTSVGADNIYMTCGAAAALTITLNALVSAPGQEVVAAAPYFPEYKVFVEAAGAKFVAAPMREKDFSVDTDKLADLINEKTVALILNSPNNPSGAVYSDECLKKVSAVVKKKSEEYSHPIYIIADEPYRELVYGDAKVGYIMNYYDDSVVCYSYSKSLSLPGERIGYIAVNPKACDADEVYLAVMGAGRALGYVCAPSLMQYVVKKCLREQPDLEAYKINRDLLYNGLKEIGYDCVRPDGAFYLFVRVPGGDALKFSECAKKYGILVVPGDGFGAPGYVRLAYCVARKTIENSLPYFKELYAETKTE